MELFSTDDLLIKLKPFGRLQILLLIASASIQFFTPLLEQCIVFLAATPDHHCRLRDGYLKNESIPLVEDDNGDQVYSSCQEYRYPGIYNETQDCQNGWEFSTDVYGETIISEDDKPVAYASPALAETEKAHARIEKEILSWDLVCTNNPAAELGQSVLQIGGLVGAFSFGILADHYGRRPSLLVALMLYNVSSLVTCFSPGFTFFLILRFFGGISHMGIWSCINSLVSEYMIPKYRNIAMTVPTVLFSFGLTFMALMAYLIRDWRYLQLAITSPVILVTASLWFVPESLRWLMSNKRNEEAFVLIKRLARINGTDVPSNIDQQETAHNSTKSIAAISGENVTLNSLHVYSTSDMGEDLPKETIPDFKEIENSYIDENKEGSSDVKPIKKYTYLDLFKPPVLHVTVILSILRFSITIVYFGFALSTGRLSGDPYLNFFYSALVEIPARILAPFIYRWFRRTYILSFCKAMCFAALTSIVFIPKETKDGTDLSSLQVALSLVGKFFITLTLPGLLLLVVELNPTPVRNMGNGWTLCIGRIGAIVSPFMLYADKYVTNFSTIVMAVFALVTAVTILTLPDTRKTPQPQNEEDLRQIMKSKREKSLKKEGGRENKAFEQDDNITKE